MPVSIPLLKTHLPANAHLAVKATIETGQLALGSNVAEFEKRLGRWSGANRVCGISDVSGALTLALYVVGVRPGHEVILSPMTCLATSMPVSNLFATPVWCDVDAETGMMDPTRLQMLITDKTRAIIVFHWSGDVANLTEIRHVANRAGIPLIEDASEAFGAEFKGARIGCGTADFTVMSFGAVRQLTCGEGAAISVSDERNYDSLQKLRRYGINSSSFRLPNGDLNPDSDIPIAGFNFPMNNIAATIGLEQFHDIDAIVQRYRDNGAYFQDALAHVPGITLLTRREDAISGYWTYSMRAERRDDLVRKLVINGIGSQRLHLRNDKYSCFASSISKDPLPGVDIFDRENLSIPCGWWVGSRERETIASCIRAGW